MSMLFYITAPDENIAKKLASGLVQAGLAAGVNIAGPVTSIYRWQGQVVEAREWQLFGQASRSAFPALRDYVLARHPHITPCILGLPIDAGHEPFLTWITQNSQCK